MRPSRLSLRISLICIPTFFVCSLSSLAYASSSPPTFKGLSSQSPSLLDLDEEIVVLACPLSDSDLNCTATIRYVVSNPTDSEVSTDALFDSPIPVTIKVNGVQQADSRTIHISLAAGQKSLVEVFAPITFPRNDPDAPPDTSALATRHPYLNSESKERSPQPVLFNWGENWHAVQKRDFDVKYPSGWRLYGSRWAAEGPVKQRLVTENISANTEPVDLDLRPVPKAFPLAIPIQNGGPVVAIGSALGEGFRMRYAYEIGVGKNFIPSLASDVDYKGLLVLTPALDAATGSMAIMPSLAAGVGIPVRVKPETRAGARLKLNGVIKLGIGVEATVDYYPADKNWDTTIVARFSM